MILYHAMSSYQLLEVIVHKCLFNNKKFSILCISLDVVRRLKNYLDLKNFFDVLVLYDNGIGNYSILQGRDFQSYFDGIFQEADIDLKNLEEIYLACAHHSFGIYVAEKNIPFIYFEDGAGAISRPEVLHRIESKFKKKDELCLELGLYDGSNPNIKKCICNFNYQKKNFTPKKNYEHFDLYDELSKLESVDRDLIIKLFTNIEYITIDKKDSVLILTEHFANLRVITWEEQIFLYQLYVDYFLQNKKLIFKTHPDDLMYYKKIFPESQIINQKFPAELLPFLFKKKPDIVSTISSTAIYGLSQCFDKFLVFDYNFTKNKEFYHLHKYYAALKIISFMKKDKYNIISYGVDSVILNNFRSLEEFKNLENYKIAEKKNLDDLKSDKNIIIFDSSSDDINDSRKICEFLLTLSDNTIVIFLNTDHKFCFYNYEYKRIWKNIIPVCIRKQRLSKGDWNTFETVDEDRKFFDEYIYFFSKRGIKMENHIEKRTLPYSGMDIEIITFEDKDLQIKRLEGILAATEKRLLYYIHKEENK